MGSMTESIFELLTPFISGLHKGLCKQLEETSEGTLWLCVFTADSRLFRG